MMFEPESTHLCFRSRTKQRQKHKLYRIEWFACNISLQSVKIELCEVNVLLQSQARRWHALDLCARFDSLPWMVAAWSRG